MTPPRSWTSSPAVAGQFVAGADAGGEHHDVDVGLGAVGELHAADPIAVAEHGAGCGAGADTDPELLDHALQRLAASGVHLQRHQPVCELDHGRLRAQRVQGAGGFQAEQPATDHGPADGSGRCAFVHPGTQAVDVVDRAVDEAAGQVVARNRWPRSVGAGGEHDRVVTVLVAVSGTHHPTVAVDLHHAGAGVQLHARALPQGAVVEQEVGRVIAGEERGQRHPVVGRPLLLAEDVDRPVVQRPPVDQRLDEPLGNHSGTHDHHSSHHAFHGTARTFHRGTAPVTGRGQQPHADSRVPVSSQDVSA